MGFTKLVSSIVQSSIMMEPPEVFKTWITLLATCESDGVSRVSPVFLASICRFTIDEVFEHLKVLESEDKLSRSINDEGARIRRVDGGYYIINYHKYREYSYSDSPAAIRQRKHRNKQGKCDTSQSDVTSLSSVTSFTSLNSKELKHIIISIVDYLNEACNTSFRATSKTTTSHINARLKEGFTLEDFKAVIDHKKAQWYTDPKMSPFLRPQTLFGTKFESYLQEAKRGSVESKGPKVSKLPEGY